MRRIPKLRSQTNLAMSLGVAGFVALSFLYVLVAFFLARDLRNNVCRIETRLRALDQDLGAPPEAFHGLSELSRIQRTSSDPAIQRNSEIALEEIERLNRDCGTAFVLCTSAQIEYGIP